MAIAQRPFMTQQAIHTPAFQVALEALELGINVLPIRPDGTKQPALAGWKRYQEERPTLSEVRAWFCDPRRGLALVTGQISGGLIALDFDDPATFGAWLKRIQRDQAVRELYEFVASGYEERTPKNGRHLLFRCPEAFEVQRRPGNQKLALRPVPEPQRFETLAETREEGGLIIVDPSRGSVHATGRPYVRLRGSVGMIRTLTPEQRTLLYDSVRAFDETPPPEQQSCRGHMVLQTYSPRGQVSSGNGSGDRPGDLFTRDPGVTWESLLVGWQLVKSERNGDGHEEGYWRHPGKVGPNHSATTNADGTDRLYCFSPSIGLPLCRYLDKFEFYAYWQHGGDFKAAARTLADHGYTTHKAEQSS